MAVIFPTAVFALDEVLRKDVEVRHARSQALGAIAPVRTASRQDRHVALQVGHCGKSIRVADQDLQNRDLEIHPVPPRPVNATWLALARELGGRPA
ncbi:hypothetical protein ACVWXN_000136 [Bradyrhizobium sp. i1.4.4]